MPRAVDIPTPAVFEPLLVPSRYKGIFGGRGGAKSHFFADHLIERCLLKSCRAVCVREVQRTLAQSVKRLIEDKLDEYDLRKEFRVLTTHVEAPNNGLILFQGMQDHTAESIKSLEGFDVAWIEEAQSLSQRSLDLLRPTIREEGSEIWASWNPRHATDPIDRLLRADPPPDAIVVQSSYQDNPFFPDVLRKEMEWDRSRDVEKYNHIWLGGYERHSEARVFKNWTVEDFETPKDSAFLFGGDWGFATDPDVLVRAFPKGRKLYIDYEAYAVGCEIDDTPRLFDGLVCGCDYKRADLPCKNPSQHGMARRWQITTDSARPETISYMQKHGYPRVVAAKKGPGSVEEGVKFLQGYDIIIHPRCVHTIDEFTMYAYKVDHLTGLVIPVLGDKKNHVIDSARYAVESLRGPRQVNAAPTGVGQGSYWGTAQETRESGVYAT